MLALKAKWKDLVWGRFTAMHFALAGMQQRVLRVLERDVDARQLFAHPFCHANDVDHGVEVMALELIPTIGRLDSSRQAYHFLKILLKQKTAQARLLKPFCCLMPDDYCEDNIELCADWDIVCCVMREMKDVGLIFYVRVDEYDNYESQTILDLTLKSKREIAHLIAQSPIRSKQIELAKRQIAKHTFVDIDGKRCVECVEPERQFAVRETSSEAAFNRFILLASRDVSWKAISPQRTTRDKSVHPLRSKLSLNATLFRDTKRFAKAQLRKMLEE